jgi:hypothetical protein
MPLSHVVGHWENTLLGRLIRSTAYDRRESGVSGVVLRPRSNGNFDPSSDSLIAVSISDQEKLMKKLTIISLLVLVAVSAIAVGTAVAQAKNGADDPIGHVRGGQGADGPAGHVPGGQGADDPAGHVRHGRGADDPAAHKSARRSHRSRRCSRHHSRHAQTSRRSRSCRRARHARHGADDGPGHIRNARGRDDVVKA